jgi:hypothetical protein
MMDKLKKCRSYGYLLLTLFLLCVLQEELVIEQLFDSDSIIWILLQAFIDEITSLFADVDIRRDGDLLLHNFNQFFLLADLEGVFADQHLVHHDSDRPDIYSLVVIVALQDLRTDVERSTAEGRAHKIAQVDGPAEVAQLYYSLVHHYVLRLYIAVDDLLGMEVTDGCAELAHDGSSFALGKGQVVLELFEELASHGYLQDDVDVLLVVEAAVELDDVGVAQEHLDLHLTDELLHNSLFKKDRLLYHL